MNNNYKESFEQIKIAGSLAAETLDEVTPYVVPGVATDKLDKICYEFIKDNSGYSAPLYYRGFPKSSCTSVNHVVCHGIPTEKYFKRRRYSQY
jgi:methionine aminopeptidase, type I (EC 3.4.11.18)